MGKKIDLTGQRFGRLVVIEESKMRNKSGNVKWKCKCDCGNYTYSNGYDLRKGNTQSCGCYNRDIVKKENPNYKKHLYFVYHSIKCRCYNPNDRAYHNYGARGIKLSDKWDTYDKFEEWSLKNGYKEGLWIDRIDNDADYSPDNCRWATPKEQQNNKRTNRLLKIGNEVKTITQWSELTGIKSCTISRRVELGWDEASLLKPVDKKRSHSEEIKKALRKNK